MKAKLERITIDPVIEEIERSERLKTLGKNWDLQGADPVDLEVYESAVTFLRSYSEYLLNVSRVRIATPEINPCRNGTIDLSWRTDRARMLINIRRKENEMTAFYYGDLKNDNEPIKGHVPANKIANHLAIWMENLKL